MSVQTEPVAVVDGYVSRCKRSPYRQYEWLWWTVLSVDLKAESVKTVQ